MKLNQSLFNLLCYYERCIACLIDDQVKLIGCEAETPDAWVKRVRGILGVTALEVTDQQLSEIHAYATAARLGDAEGKEVVRDLPRMPDYDAPVLPSTVGPAPVGIRAKHHLVARAQANLEGLPGRNVAQALRLYEGACRRGAAEEVTQTENDLRRAIEAAQTVRGECP